jgi:hypothetical protein
MIKERNYQKINLFLAHQTSKRNANSTQCSQALFQKAILVIFDILGTKTVENL